MKLAFIDDEQKVLDQYKQYIDKFSKLHPDIEVEGYYFTSSLDFFEAEIPELDGVFLDILLKETSNGLDVAEEIRKNNEHIFIIFATNMSQYAVNGYRVHAFDFLLKPISYENFEFDLLKLARNIKSDSGKYLWFSYKKLNKKIFYDEILYIDSYQHDVTIHTDNNQSYTFRYTINELMTKINSEHFMRVSKAYIVNLKKVIGFEEDMIIMKNGTKLLVPIKRKKEFLDALNKDVFSKK